MHEFKYSACPFLAAANMARQKLSQAPSDTAIILQNNKCSWLEATKGKQLSWNILECMRSLLTVNTLHCCWGHTSNSGVGGVGQQRWCPLSTPDFVMLCMKCCPAQWQSTALDILGNFKWACQNSAILHFFLTFHLPFFLPFQAVHFWDSKDQCH